MSQAPIILLVEPQLVENIGMAARAMMNCGLSEMRIVDPRDPWPLEQPLQERMDAASSGAHEILHSAKIFATVEEAIKDLNFIYATTARSHNMINNIYTARGATPEMKVRIGDGQKVAVMFGRERTGLINDHIVLANAKITIPLNPEFASLNLAQAVLLIGYEWYQANDSTPSKQLDAGRTRPATREEYLFFWKRLEGELEQSGFFVAEDMREFMSRSLQNSLQRAELTEQEIRTWHGVISALIGVSKRSQNRYRPAGDA